MPYPSARLQSQPAANVRVGHRGQRMVLQAAFVEQPVIDEKMPLIDRAPGCGKGRTNQNRLTDIQSVGERIYDRTDVPSRGRIEGRAVLEVVYLTSLGPQPIQRGQRLLDRVARRYRPRFEGDETGQNGRISRPLRDTNVQIGRASCRERGCQVV